MFLFFDSIFDENKDKRPKRSSHKPSCLFLYIYTQNNSNVKNTWNKIVDVVKVTSTMVFSVIGDSDCFLPRPWPKTVFQTALIDAAKSGGGKQREAIRNNIRKVNLFKREKPRIVQHFDFLETWILYSGSEQGVSKAVENAYLKYGNREFGTKNFERPIDYKNRHIKLISTTDTTVVGITQVSL